jgi:serine protease Do
MFKEERMKGIFLATMMLVAAIPVLAQETGWIGVSIEDQKDGGAIVRRVEPNSPAEKAGLKEGDVILEFNREAVIGVQQLTRLVRETPVGRTVDLKVRRDNREQTLKVTAERTAGRSFGRFELDVPNVHILADGALKNIQSYPFPFNNASVQSGVRVEQMTDQLRDFFGVFSNSGVLVASVDAGSAAEKAGIKAGDVITTVDGRNIRTPQDFSREMRADSKPMIKIIRDKQEREIRIE